MVANSSQKSAEPSLRQQFREDFRSGNLKRTLMRDYKELKEFYLTKERRARLKKMGRVQRWVFTTWWLLKALFLKLTPVRRILLLIGLVLILSSDMVIYTQDNVRYQNDTNFVGSLVLLFVLMLELKDKLLARDELEAGRTVQQALMPPTRPEIPNWSAWLYTRAANEVGGDLVDFMEIERGQFGIALGDVSGKGLGAALFMAKLQATIRALAPDFESLADFGKKINEIFFRDSTPQSFASLVYLEIQSASGTVRLLNAGHPPPVLIRNATMEELPKGAPALGLLSEEAFTEQHLSLESGDALFVYSDGLTEAQNEQGALFGEKRMFELLPQLRNVSPDEFGTSLLSEIHHFVGEAKTSDDLSLVILKRLA